MRKYLAELVGTFCLIFIGTGSVVVNEVSKGAIGHIGICMCFGLIVIAIIYAIGEISGAHINPAVSFALLTNRQIQVKEFILYVIFQTIGAILASFTLRVLFPSVMNLGLTLPLGSEIQAFIIEVFLAFFLMFVVARLSPENQLSGLIVGIVVALAALFAGPITGASMNPARSLAPALVSGNLQSLWIYLTAPFIGTFLGITLATYFSIQDKNIA